MWQGEVWWSVIPPPGSATSAVYPWISVALHLKTQMSYTRSGKSSDSIKLDTSVFWLKSQTLEEAWSARSSKQKLWGSYGTRPRQQITENGPNGPFPHPHWPVPTWARFYQLPPGEVTLTKVQQDSTSSLSLQLHSSPNILFFISDLARLHPTQALWIWHSPCLDAPSALIPWTGSSSQETTEWKQVVR